MKRGTERSPSNLESLSGREARPQTRSPQHQGPWSVSRHPWKWLRFPCTPTCKFPGRDPLVATRPALRCFDRAEDAGAYEATSSERGTLARDVRTISKVSPLAGANCSSAATQLARTRAAQHRHVSTSSCANTADGQPERAGLACSPQTEGHPLAPLHCEARHRRFFVSQLCRSRLCSVVQQKRNFDHFV